MCLPYLKFSEPLPETHLFFYLALANSADPAEMLCFVAFCLGLHSLPEFPVYKALKLQTVFFKNGYNTDIW